MQRIKVFLRFAIVALVIGLSVGYVLADWVNPGGPPSDLSGTNAAAPINVSGTDQIKVGGFGTNGPLSGPWVFAINKLGIGPGADSVAELDPTAVLDVDGQIRIRGGCPAGGGGCQSGQVLKAVDSTGLAQWGINEVGVTSLKEGFGIDLGATAADYLLAEIAGSGFIQIADGMFSVSQTNKTIPEVQRRVGGLCGAPNAITYINNDGTVSCRSFVTSVEANSGSGLILKDSAGTAWTTATTGPISLAVNVAASNSGLRIDPADNVVKLNLNTAVGDGDGLTIDSVSNRVKFEPCGTNQTWKYDTATSKWGCSDFPPPPTNYPGGSVIYLKDWLFLSGISCPSGFTASSVYTENVGGGKTNSVKVCYRTDKTCQALRLVSTSEAGLAACPASPWAIAGGGGYLCGGVACNKEYAPGGALLNYVRNCYVCY